MTAPRTVFTIGHSTHDFEAFVLLLKGHSINAVADVRSQPQSRLLHFCRPALEAGLKDNGIHYVFLGRELGARRTEAECYVDDQAAYERIVTLAEFQDRAGNAYSLKVTDPEITRRLERGKSISKKCLLTISMTKPWTPNEEAKPPLCYKVVAAVIEIT